MNDQNRRSALQVVADAARKIKAAARIVRAALLSRRRISVLGGL